MDDSKFASLDDLRESISTGYDIEFMLAGKRYNISWRERPFICACPDGEAVFYDSPDEMLDHCIDGVPLRDAWDKIDIIGM